MANAAQYYDVVRRPVVTEKSAGVQESKNQYTFEVAKAANKVEVRKAVETLFSVKVEAVNIITMPAKRRRVFGRPGHSPAWKKAIVTLKDGDSIDVN
ncbi:MAG: 50S ribosomal protein L23 [Planctomycetota bacterium]|nr:50S ribosomal protein L23 [Planctomycetota bacterium]MEC8651261.1 50S ribosomal protein L23 [Planctomycetota bacterium]MEC9048008.1 50S ribosomal protein L23 [Planctomycetota bacterium]